MQTEFQDRIELAKGSHYTIVLDENLRTILTANSKDFTDDAVHFDYDVIAVENIKFIDSRPDSTNQTVAKISGAIRRSQLATRKGNFLLTVEDDGSFHLRQLT